MLSPAYKLVFADPPAGGLLGTAASVIPGAGSSARVIDTTEDAQASTVKDLQVSLDMDVPANRFELRMGQVGSFRPAQGSQITIELGYAGDDDLTQVIKGTADAVRPGLQDRFVIGYSAASVLMRTRVDETFESKKAGEIVEDLANRAGIEVADLEQGFSLPAYVIDGRRSVFQHMQDLAQLCGFDVYFNSENELIFKKFTSGNTVHLFDYTRHILALDLSQLTPAIRKVQAFGEGPGGSQSAEAWAWLTKDFSGSAGSSGEDDPVLLLERPALRTGEAAQKAADAAITTLRRKGLQGRLQVLGNPAIQLGDAIRLREVPETVANDTFQVRSVQHRITKKHGFITTVGFRSL